MKLAALLLTFATCACAAPFEIKEGDRVLLLGDALLERENTYGLLETRMHEQFPNVKFTVRNLSWSGETPKGWSRASFDGPEKGWERLKEQIAEVKPTVAILGFGMAASLQEMTDRSGDQTLNPDPVRYGAEPMSAARFKKELAELMDAINASTPNKQPARFILLSPIRHEDLRKGKPDGSQPPRPGLPDPARHNALLDQYTTAIKALATERSVTFVHAKEPWIDGPPLETENGIIPSPKGYELLCNQIISRALEWGTPPEKWRQQSLNWLISRKNDLFFHQFRPANSTYLFGFRKHEQGKNAAEMPKFTPLIEAADAEIDKTKRMSKTELALQSGMPPFDGPWKDHRDVKLPKAKANAGAADPSPSATDLQLHILAESKFKLGGFETDSLEALSAELKRQIKTGDTRVVLKVDKTIKYSALRKVLDVVAKAGIANVIFPTEPEKIAPPLPLPNFTVADGFELTLWADTDLVGKPVGMNWDAQGRLWVACSPVYPQIEPGAHPHDKVVVLEDTDRDGKADKTTTFATNLLIAAGVAPDFAAQSSEAVPASSKTNPGEKPGTPQTPATPKTPAITAAYVGSSTELVRAEDTNGDGISDQRRVVLSGFGTEDTHHTIHTLRWGPDGRLYFNQSIYIHSHMETPWGIVRLNSGGICAYDPRTERVEVFARGFINTWGHAWDQWGQSFATDGAGFEGVHWIIPGAMYRTYEGARRILPSISPGTYPKYCGLELIQSPLFPEDWQGNAITCDFRAHKITRFQINDLSQPTEPGKEPLSGYVTKELPNPVVTSDASFRPIDVKLGPDGALYIADWTNPIINHGEVDFRDPRRDHTNGRIWRLAPKGKAALKWENRIGKAHQELMQEALSGDNLWTKEQSRRVLGAGEYDRFEGNFIWGEPLHSATAPPPDDFIRFVASRARDLLHLPQGSIPKFTGDNLDQIRAALDEKAGPNLAQVCRFQVDEETSRRSGREIPAANQAQDKRHAELFGMYARSKHPRVRVEGMRALARTPTVESAALILEAALKVPGGAAKQVRSEDKGTNQFNQPTFSDTADPYYGYAAWLSVNDLAPQVMEWVERTATAASTKDEASGSAGASPVVPGAPPGTANVDNPATRDAKIAYALHSLRPEQTSTLLAKILKNRGLPKDGSGPWIELIGQAGGKNELKLLADGLLANTATGGENPKPLADKALAFTNEDANHRAAAALVNAARRGAKPDVSPATTAEFVVHAPGEALVDAVRLAGLWKHNVPESLVSHINMNDTPAALKDAVFESLRTLGTADSATYLSAFLTPNPEVGANTPMLKHALANSDPATRRRALTALASVRPAAALSALNSVLNETNAAGQLALWRELFGSEPFAKAIVAKLPDLTKDQAAPALRAARELGKRGEKLVAAFTPLAGETAVADVPMNVNALVDMTKKNGNPAEGELIYRRAALTCTVCHAIGGAGGKVGPDLGTIGASAPLDYIIESTVNPAVKVKEGFHAIAVTTKDGKTLSGTIAKETDSGMVLRDMTGAEQSVEKTNIKERTNIGSLMPAGLVNTINDREKANLFAFMSQLGKPGPFDAGKSSIARTWRIYPGDQVEHVVANKADASKAIAVHSLVDGRVTKELLEVPLAVAGANPTIVAAARFNTLSAAKSRLHLAGITKAWLDGAPLAIASDPNPVVDLAAGDHTLVIKLDTAAIPAHFRAEVPEARFLTE